MKAEKKRLGEMLIEAGIIDEMQLNAALGQQRQWGGKLGSKLIEMGFVDEKSIASVLEKQLGEKCISLKDREIHPKVLNTLKHEIAKKYCIIPLDFDKNALSIATSDPTDVKTLDDLSFMLGVRIKPVLALESDIKNAIAKHYEGATNAGKTYKATMENIPEKMQVTQDITEEMEIIRTEPAAAFLSKEIHEKPPEKKEITSKAVIETIIAILIEKGIITREELVKKLDEKSRKS